MHRLLDEKKDDQSARFFINIGKKDGYDWMSMKDFLRDALGLVQYDVFKVDVKDSFSFFNTETVHMPKVLEFFSDFKQNGRYINVEITEKKERRGNRRFGGQKGGRSRRKDGFRSEGRGNRKDRRKDNGGRSPRRSSDFKPQGSSSSRPRRNRRK